MPAFTPIPASFALGMTLSILITVGWNERDVVVCSLLKESVDPTKTKMANTV